MDEIERENLPLRWIRLTFGFIQLFDLQWPIPENLVGADVDRSTACINDQSLLTGLPACKKKQP